MLSEHVSARYLAAQHLVCPSEGAIAARWSCAAWPEAIWKPWACDPWACVPASGCSQACLLQCADACCLKPSWAGCIAAIRIQAESGFRACASGAKESQVIAWLLPAARPSLHQPDKSALRCSGAPATYHPHLT